VILDLAGGKGGDLKKYAALKAAVVHIVDQSGASLRVAQERALASLAASASGSASGLPFVFSTQKASFTDEAAYPAVHGLVDVVSCQFALHYVQGFSAAAARGAASEASGASEAEFVIERIARSLRPGGVFLCTVPNSKRIELFKNSRICKIRNLTETSYSFYLQGSVGTAKEGVTEYVVERDVLQSLAAKHGLELVHYREYGSGSAGGGPGGNALFSALRWDEKEVAKLYCEYAFQKKESTEIVSQSAAVGWEELPAEPPRIESGWCPLTGAVEKQVVRDGFK